MGASITVFTADISRFSGTKGEDKENCKIFLIFPFHFISKKEKQMSKSLFTSILCVIFVKIGYGQGLRLVYLYHNEKSISMTELQLSSLPPTVLASVRKDAALSKFKYDEHTFVFANGRSAEQSSRNVMVRNGEKTLDANRLSGGKFKTYKNQATHQVTIDAYEDKTPVIDLQKDFNWLCSDEKKIIGTFNCTKCLGEFYGDTLTAWYTNEIPISEGPFIYAGLPGLIVYLEAKNENKHMVYTLDEVVPLKKEQTPEVTIPTYEKKMTWAEHLDFSGAYRTQNRQKAMEEINKKHK